MDELFDLMDTKSFGDFGYQSGTVVYTLDDAQCYQVHWFEIMERIGDEEAIRQVAQFVAEDGLSVAESLQKAIAEGNAHDAHIYSRKVRGTALMFGAARLEKNAYQLQNAAQYENMPAARELLESVKSEYLQLVAFLRRSDWIDLAKGTVY